MADKPLTPQELADLPDSEIDYSDIPPLDEDFWENAKLVKPGAVTKSEYETAKTNMISGNRPESGIPLEYWQKWEQTVKDYEAQNAPQE